MELPYTEPLHPVQIEIYKKMSPSKKLEIMEQLWRDAWALKWGYFSQLHPEWDEHQLQKACARAMMLAGDE